MEATPKTNPIYFPPPPKSATASVETKKGIKLNFSKSRDADTASITSSLQKPPRPILKRTLTSTKRTRQWILLFLLVLSFTILILSVIFAYCAALPHSDNLSAAADNGTAISTSPAAEATTTTTATLVSISSATATSTSYTPSRFMQRDTATYANPNPSQSQSNTDEAALASDQTKTLLFTNRPAMAALTFYTACLPLLTMLHTAAELLTSFARPETSQSTRLGDTLRFRQSTTEGIVTRRRIGTLLSFSASTLLALGWLIMEMFWLNCEISSFTAHSEAVCPIQIRGHRMKGISELSVGKVILTLAVILAYVVYAVYLVKKVGVFSKKVVNGTQRASFRRRTRFASRGMSLSDAESVVIGIEHGEAKETGY